jgi:hypothetical protein
MKTEEEQVLALNDPQQSYLYCWRNKSTANIELHEQIIINSRNIKYCRWFVEDVSDKNMDVVEQIVISSRDPHECHLFAVKVKNSNKQLLSDIVLSSGNLKYIKEFYKSVDFDKTRYETLLLFI